MLIDDYLNQTHRDIYEYITEPKILNMLMENHIYELREIQKEAIRNGLFFMQNFLVCSPAGSGKTLIGELAILNNILINPNCVCVYLIPYRAIAIEKFNHFKNNYSNLTNNICLSIGDYESEIFEIKNSNILITTFEKFDSILRNLEYKNPWLDNLSVVVIDEVHVMGDYYRGSILESLIIKLIMQFNIQLICLSATIANPENFNNWLNFLSMKYLGKPFFLIKDSIRPTELKYRVEIMSNKESEIRKILIKCYEEKGQALLFSYTRKSTEHNAEIYKKTTYKYLTEDEKQYLLSYQKEFDKISAHSRNLRELIKFGVAFHHAGLHPQEKKLVEFLYNKNYIKLICCTTTLSAGINTPAKVVILKDFKQRLVFNPNEQQLIDATYIGKFGELPFDSNYFVPYNNNQLFQLLGRAARPNYTSEGEGIICVKNEDEYQWVIENYFDVDKNDNLVPKYSPIISSINKIGALREHLLLLIYQFKKISLNKIIEFFKNTFFVYSLKIPPEIDLSEFLRLKNMSSKTILNLHCDTNKINHLKKLIRDLNFELIKENRVICNIKLHQWFKIDFNMETGIVCSCRRIINPSKLTFNNIIRIDYNFCDHIIALLSVLNYYDPILNPNLKPKSNHFKLILNYINDIMVHVLKCERILDFLVEHGFIIERNNVFEPTTLGILTIRLYLRPEELIFIRTEIIDQNLDNIELILSKCYQCLIMQGKWTNSDFLQEIILWINETSIGKILEINSNIGGGDFFSFKEELVRLLQQISIVANFYDNEEIEEITKILSLRIYYGVKEELLPLVTNLQNIGRVRARILYNAGYQSIVDIANSKIDEIHSNTQFSVNLCQIIYSEAKRILDDKSKNSELFYNV